MITRNPFDLPAGRILALDIGSVRVGLAITDRLRTLATSVGIVPRKPWGTLKAKIGEWQGQGVTAVVLGWPLNMDGSEGPACTAVRSVADLIAKETGLPVLLWDERLTSQQAEAAFFMQREGRQTRASKRDSVGYIDAAAATLLLQGVCDALRS